MSNAKTYDGIVGDTIGKANVAKVFIIHSLNGNTISRKSEF